MKNQKLLLAVLLIALAFQFRGGAATVLGGWRWRNPLPQGQALRGVTYGDGSFVAVGFGGAIVTSTDGTNWLDCTLPINPNIRDVTFGKGRFVAVGGGYTLVSTNGRDWSYQLEPQPNDFSAVVFGADRFVAGGWSGIKISSDGVQWSLSYHYPVSDLAFGNGAFVAVSSTRGIGAAWSKDGINWFRGISDEAFSKIVFGKGVFVAVNSDYLGVYTSTEGRWWNYHFLEGTDNLKAIGYGEDAGFVVLNSKKVFASTDGTNWVGKVVTNAPYLYDVAYGNGLYVAVGGRGVIQVATDPLQWHTSQFAQTDLRGVTYGNGQFLAFGPSALLTSMNGILWEDTHFGSSNAVVFVGAGGGRYLANVMASSPFNWLDRSILSSSNLVDWVKCSGTTTNLINSFVYASGLHVAVGEAGSVMISTNGVHWEVQTPETQASLRSVDYGNGQFVAVGWDGAMIASADGRNWHSINSGTTNDLIAIKYGNGRFVAAGGDWNLVGTILTSTNGLNWEVQNTHIPYSSYDLAFGNGMFVVVPNRAAPPHMWWSPDGSTWSIVEPGISDWPISHIAYGAGTFIAVSDWGAIVQSENVSIPILRLTKYPGQPGTVLDASGQLGRQYRLQHVVDVGNSPWVDLLEYTNDRPVMTFTNDSLGSRSFYRVVSP